MRARPDGPNDSPKDGAGEGAGYGQERQVPGRPCGRAAARRTAGGGIAADSKVILESAVDRCMMAGESPSTRPRAPARPGTVALTGRMVVRADKVGDTSSRS